jgi:hypothetical protein
VKNLQIYKLEDRKHKLCGLEVRLK